MSTDPGSPPRRRPPEPGRTAPAGADSARTASGGESGTDRAAARTAPGADAGPVADGAPGASGPELARAVLDAAKARRGAAARTRRTGGAGGTGGERRLRGYSGPGPDPRDPQPLGAVLDRLVKARGWQQPAAEATVFGAWERVVGPDVAQHSRPVKLEDGELTVEARSTAWATQLRLLAASLLRQIASEVGHNVVRKLHIHGPAAPSWSRGPRRVRGRGPRDTYG
ncbi:Predicted nucleic acid-binding protein, contains Zn-ribbon domain (includes truncated derivatives) [Micromonospora nigra]|uniref:Predicted nucleic acid-binding protein, contains Zn-ribbon domain (Includes truncated derivatives) n=1 Tax=Micromonospora nigra TaxID=145857 RepID=A0A1C6S0A5_9ACTN|nr:DciA family protein [Micromonospora nigra]SCL22792.1 Predicted nucleic acid-binding protein, contains Zn-ribbon domain (includes truncated derivatives) [Micromonospora nigra]